MKSTKDLPEEATVDEQSIRAGSGWKPFLIFLAVVVAAIAAVVVAVVLLGDRMPELTEAALADAEKRWDAGGIRDYTMDLEIEGRRAGKVHIEVAGGKVIKMERDGKTPTQRRTWDVWSVQGQFDMMRRELDIAANPAAELQLQNIPDVQVMIRARFHPQLGYPLGFRHATLGEGTQFAWKVTRFKATGDRN